MHHDLFPETLLVSASDGHSFTTSLKVAEYFGKRHKHVLRAIDSLISDLPPGTDHRPKFGPMIYLDKAAKGARREQPMYRLSRDGFALLAMGFTGAEALRWKVAFLDAFNAMEAQLLRQTRAEAEALYRLRPRWKPISENPRLRRDQLCLLTGHRSPNSITAAKRRMRECGVLAG